MYFNINLHPCLGLQSSLIFPSGFLAINLYAFLVHPSLVMESYTEHCSEMINIPALYVEDLA